MLYRDSPGLTRFMEGICASLRSGAPFASVVMPTPYQEDFALAFQKYADYFLNCVYKVDFEPDADFLTALEPYFRHEKEINCSTDLFDLPSLDGATLLLKYPERASARADFVSFATEAAARGRAARTDNRFLPWNMVFVVPPGINFPKEDVGFTTSYWWGARRRADLEYIVEEEIPASLGEPARLWLYALCRGLCDGWPDLVPGIVSHAPGTLTDVVELLKRSPMRDKKIGEIAKNYFENYSPSLTRENKPRDYAEAAWRMGILDLDGAGRPVAHPAATLEVFGPKAIEKLVVKGQLQVYFPLVQEAVNLLSESIEKKLGRNWNKGIEEQVVEIGGLYYHLSATLPTRELSEEFHLASLWRELRNTLAHHKMLNLRTALLATKGLRKN